MATGTGKTRTAVALLKRLFEANWTTRALFVVDRNTLAVQAEDAFTEHLPHLPCYRVPRIGAAFRTRSGSRSSPCKRWSTSMPTTRPAISTALFLDTFGDPITNPKGWAVTTLGDLIAEGPQNGPLQASLRLRHG